MKANTIDTPKKRIEELANLLGKSKSDLACSIGLNKYSLDKVGVPDKKGNAPRGLSISIAMHLVEKYHDTHGVTLDWLYGFTNELDIEKKESNDRASLIIDNLREAFNIRSIRRHYQNTSLELADYDYFVLSIDSHLNHLLEKTEKAQRDRECGEISEDTYLTMISDIKQKYNNAVNNNVVGTSIEWALLPNDKITDEIILRFCEDAIETYKNQNLP